jgi:SAM-dependent methyltransferase
MPDERTRIVQAGYDGMARRHLAWIQRIKGDPRERFLSEFMARLREPARVLVLGCGAGIPATKQLAERFAVTGVDISEEQLRIARERVPTATFVRADLLDLELEAQTFDGIIAVYAMSHTPRDHHAALFQKIAGWLKPGGWFLASLGAQGCPDTVQRWLGVEMFFSSHDGATNRRLITKSGLTIKLHELVSMREPESEATFLWVLAQRS